MSENVFEELELAEEPRSTGPSTPHKGKSYVYRCICDMIVTMASGLFMNLQFKRFVLEEFLSHL